MALYDALFRSSHLLTLLSPKRWVHHMLQFEQALVQAQAEENLVPTSAAEIIAAHCQENTLDILALQQAIPSGGNAAIPLVKQLTQRVHNSDPEASKYVHWGATSQDVIDTAMVLMMTDVQAYLEELLTKLLDELHRQATLYQDTPMMGRTLLQQARPITLGLKMAQWHEGLQRTRTHLQHGKADWQKIQCGGAVGSGNKFIPQNVQKKAADLLGLQASTSWHTQRDSLVRWASELGILSGQVGKIARDISLLAQTEIAEVAEGQSGGSSSMPQKQNPVLCAAILANATRVPGVISTLYATVMQEHERGLGSWHAEWETLETLMHLTVGSLEKTCDLIQSLVVFPEKMRSNIEKSGGFWQAEEISLLLAETLGKTAAHAWVQKACLEAKEKGVSLLEHIAQAPELDQINIKELNLLDREIRSCRELARQIL